MTKYLSKGVTILFVYSRLLVRLTSPRHLIVMSGADNRLLHDPHSHSGHNFFKFKNQQNSTSPVASTTEQVESADLVTITSLSKEIVEI